MSIMKPVSQWCALALESLTLPPPFVVLLTLLIAVSPAVAQQRRVDDRNFGERLVLIVPLVGDGSPRNPFRPLFAPAPDEMQASGMLGYTAVLSDDKKFALIELVAQDRKAFDAIFKDTRVDVKKFDHLKGAIDAEFRKHKKDFDFGKFKEGK